jgi:N-acetylglutamate synthase-like GNAT family acetyltransferase
VTHVIRIAAPDDAPAVTALLEVCYPKLFAAGYEPDLLKLALPRMTKANPRLLASGNFFVAEAGAGRLVGCGGWSLERPGTGQIREGEAHIRHFATHPDWLRRGIGGAIIEQCVAKARGTGVERLECHSSLVAIRFYEAMGFTVVGQMTIDLGPDVALPGYLMRRGI